MKRSRLFLLIVVLLSLTMVLAACNGDDDPGVDDNVEDAIDDAADDVEDAADEAADDVEEAVTDVAEDVDEALGDEEVTVSMTDNEYGEANLSVAPGTTVTWVNEGSNTHTVTADDGSFDSGDMAPGDSFSHTFVTEGVFSYHCEYHQAEGMVASVEVTSS